MKTGTKKPKSDSPRTDKESAILRRNKIYPNDAVGAEFARQLERELAWEIIMSDALIEVNTKHCVTISRLTGELAEARSLYEQACQAEDAVLAANKDNCHRAERLERIADRLAERVSKMIKDMEDVGKKFGDANMDPWEDDIKAIEAYKRAKRDEA